jgi:Na+/melibiose symporter-like transporter
LNRTPPILPLVLLLLALLLMFELWLVESERAARLAAELKAINESHPSMHTPLIGGAP